MRSNCTFMELKWKSGAITLHSLYSSNCTFMELKWIYKAFFFLASCSNCTFMELKLILLRLAIIIDKF